MTAAESGVGRTATGMDLGAVAMRPAKLIGTFLVVLRNQRPIKEAAKTHRVKQIGDTLALSNRR